MLTTKEKELLTLLRADDPKALRILFDQFHTSFCMLAYRIVKDRELAKDVVQDVFLKFWNGRNTIEITTSIEAYLKRAVANTSLNALEKQATRKIIPLEGAEQFHTPVNTIEADQSFNELQATVDRTLTELPPRTRAVFILIRFEQMSYMEVSVSLGISLKAVEKEMMKALKILREALKEYLNPSVILLALSALY